MHPAPRYRPICMKRTLLLLALICLPSGALAQSTDWPQWRGADLDGHSADTKLPTTWSASQNVVWKVPIPGRGHSSPVVSGNRIFLTTCLEKEGRRVVLCLDRADGRVLWERDVFRAPLERKHPLNNHASSTPATDGKHVYAAFLEDPPDAEPRVQVVCFDLEGTEVWRKSPGVFKSMHGWAAAVVLYEETLLLNLDQDSDAAALVALDKATGNEIWRTERPNRTRSYTNPIIVDAAGKKQMVLTGSKSTASYDPATGKQIWTMDGPTEQFVASPVYTDGVFFVTGGFPTYHYVGIRPEATGDVSEDEKFVLYHEKTGAYVPSPVGVGRHVFMVSDRPGSEGTLWCIEAKTGRLLKTRKLGKHHRPSPVYANGLLYFLSDQGDTYVVRADENLELVAKNSLGEPAGDRCFASPAASDGRLFIRTVEHLYCVGQK